MREIKFRTWNGRCKEMTTPAVWVNDENLVCSQMTSTPTHELMKFTGLKDSNGVDIYEGDIVETSFFEDYDNECQFVESGEICTGVVEQHASGTWLAVDDRDGVWLSLYHVSDYSHTKVIGNIHENPELIKEIL